VRDEPADPRVSVVVITRSRVHGLASTLDRLERDAGAAEIIVVDNASTDGTAAMVRERHPRVRLIRSEVNLGAAGRNLGVAAARTPYVAFSDDDSHWARGALRRAAEVLDRHPRLGLVAARLLVGEGMELDPTCLGMAASPLPGSGALPGPPVLGFLACAAVVRAAAHRGAGGFAPRLGVGGEEELFAVDLAERGWDLCYVDAVVAHHHPSALRDPAARRRVQARNRLWSLWLRRPLGVACRGSLDTLRDTDGATARRALVDAARGLPWVLRARRRVSPAIEAQLRLLETSTRSARAGGRPPG
jgi:N-acetylglucosaminyl-diphospho-decaprenol L-rhamnosyltransferase